MYLATSEMKVELADGVGNFELERSVPRAGAELKPHSETVILIKRRRLLVIPLAALPAIKPSVPSAVAQ